MGKKEQDKKLKQRNEKLLETQKKELAEKIFLIGLMVSENPNFLTQLKQNPEFAKQFLRVNKEIENSKKYHDVGEKLGVNKENLSNSNKNLQKTLEVIISNNRDISEEKNVDPVDIVGGNNDNVEGN
jgi:hypothetical protein